LLIYFKSGKAYKIYRKPALVEKSILKYNDEIIVQANQ